MSKASLPFCRGRLHPGKKTVAMRPTRAKIRQFSAENQALMERSEGKFLSLWWCSNLASYSFEAYTIVFTALCFDRILYLLWSVAFPYFILRVAILAAMMQMFLIVMLSSMIIDLKFLCSELLWVGDSSLLSFLLGQSHPWNFHINDFFIDFSFTSWCCMFLILNLDLSVLR